jgi:2-dehydro-3-deoxygluconokinase
MPDIVAPDIVALGEAMIEFNEQPDGRYVQGFGGDTSNAIIAAARLGASTRYLTLLGQDRFGDQLMDLWTREKVDTTFIGRHASAPTAVYFVNHGPKGHEFTYLRRGSAASRMSFTDFPPAAFAGAKFLHVSAVSQAISYSARDAVGQAVEFASQTGAMLCYDTNLRLRLWRLEEARDAIHATAHRAQVLKTSIEDATTLLGLVDPEAVASHYLDLGAAIAVVTLGPDGALVATPERRERIAPHKVKFVDATGAGDAFAGALLASLLRGFDPFAATRFANVAAAIATTGYGAVAPLPTREQVEQLLR